MINFETINQNYVIQEKRGITPHFYLWEKSDWIDSFKGKISLRDAIEKSKNNKITFFAMPESKHFQTFLDVVAINSILGLETIDQLSLYVQAKIDKKNDAFVWDDSTPENLVESKKLLNEVLGFSETEKISIQKQNYEKWFSQLI